MNKYFEIEKRGSNIKTEIIAGVTIFLSMVYVLFVIPETLSQGGMEQGAVFTATALSAVISTLLMGLYAKYPVALAPGMGMQAFFTYGIVLGSGYTWQEGLFAIFVSGLLFITLSVTGLRKIIINSIPNVLKHSVTIGIGLFIAFIGMQNVGIIVGDPDTVVALGDFSNPVTLLALIGIIVTFVLIVKNSTFAIFIGMIITAVIGIIFQFLGLDVGMTAPSGIVASPPSLEPIFGQLFDVNIGELLTDFSFWVIIISVLFVDFFDTAGTIMAIGSEAGSLDKDGQIKDSDKILLVDSIGTTVGAVIGVSSVTSYVESLTGVKAGGRTGLSAVVVSICFLIALLFSPLLVVVVSSITAPALITVGALMAMNNAKIDYSDFTNAATAFFTSIIMLLSYSISAGLAAGFIIYTILMTVQGKKQSVLLYILSFIFLLYFFI
ncbi:MAG: NCS2 family permease [Mycoplasmatales bacterium]